MKYVFDIKNFPSVDDALDRLAAIEALLAGVIVPRSIVSTQIVNGRLIITYSDGTTQDAGAIGGGTTPPVDPPIDPPVAATINNTPDTTQLRPIDIQGMSDFVNMIDAILTAKGR